MEQKILEQRLIGVKYENFDKDVEQTAEVIRANMLLLLAQADGFIINEIAKEIRLLYPTHDIRVAISKYYDEVVMGGSRWNTKLEG